MKVGKICSPWTHTFSFIVANTTIKDKSEEMYDWTGYKLFAWI